MHAAKMEMLLDEMGYDIIGIVPSSDDFLRLFRATLPDLIILDIELKDGGDGVDIAEKVNAIRPTPLIYATSYEDKESIKRALKTDPYSYLVKPVEKPSLQAAIELALFKFAKAHDNTQVDSPVIWSDDLILNGCFLVKSSSILIKIPFAEILWIEVGHDRYCDLVTTQRRYPIRTSMSLLEQKLDPKVFVRIHRSHIINIQKMVSIDDQDMVVDIAGNVLPLGGAYKSNLLDRFKIL